MQNERNMHANERKMKGHMNAHWNEHERYKYMKGK